MEPHAEIKKKFRMGGWWQRLGYEII